MTIYDDIEKIGVSHPKDFTLQMHFYFTEENRKKFSYESDARTFSLLKRIFSVDILYMIDLRQDKNLDYRMFDGSKLIPFSDEDIQFLKGLDYSGFPLAVCAQVFDVIWLCNRDYQAAIKASDSYFKLYKARFDPVDWAECFNYISRCIELAAKVNKQDQKDEYLRQVYDDVIKLDGNDQNGLSENLITLLLNQKYNCDYSALLPIANNLINNSSDAYMETAYAVKSRLYKKTGNDKEAQQTYIDYAKKLVKDAETSPKRENRDWFIAIGNIKKAIELYQNNGASGKAAETQRKLTDLQEESMKHVSFQTINHPFDLTEQHDKFIKDYSGHDVRELILDLSIDVGFQNKEKIRNDVLSNPGIGELFSNEMLDERGRTVYSLKGLDPKDEENILEHMYHRAKEYETITGDIVIAWFIELLNRKQFQESDFDFIFENNPIVPKGQEKIIQHGIYLGLTGHMQDSIDNLAPKAENIIRYVADMCGDVTYYYDSKTGVQQARVLGELFQGEKLNECVEENILFTFNGLLQQKTGSNIRNLIGHGLDKESDYHTGDCLYLVVMVLKWCAMMTDEYDEAVRQRTIQA